MSGSYRLLILAACGITLLLALGIGAYFGSLYAPDHKQYETITGDQRGENDYSGPSQSLPDISGIPGPVERAIANPHPATGQDHEKRDLAAQEASALWAFWMVVASFASVVITAIGTIFLYRQIVLTREAVGDTNKATVAMQEANLIAAESLIQNDRAWLKIDLTLVDDVKVQPVGETGREIRCGLELVITNVGARPAINVSIALQLLFTEALRTADKQAALSAKQRDVPEKGWFPNVTLFPNASFQQRWNLGSGGEELESYLKMFTFDDGGLTVLMLSVIGCIQYRMPANAKLHQTGINFTIDRISTSDRGPALFFEDLPMRAETLRLTYPFDGPGVID